MNGKFLLAFKIFQFFICIIDIAWLCMPKYYFFKDFIHMEDILSVPFVEHHVLEVEVHALII